MSSHNIKLSHLRVFCEVATHGSITLAAEKLHRTPSAVSMTVSNLENNLGQALFEAESKSSLTAFGKQVLEIALSQIRQYDRAVTKIRSFANHELGRIDISSVPSFAMTYLPELISEFKDKFPGIQIHVTDASTAQIIQQLQNEEIDIGFTAPPADSTDVVFENLLTDTIGVVCRAQHDLTQLQRKINWSDIAKYPFIYNGTCSLIHNEQFQEITHTASLSIENTTSLLAMVAADQGVTTLPRLAVPSFRKDIVFLETRYSELTRNIGMVKKSQKNLPPAAQQFSTLAIKRFNLGKS